MSNRNREATYRRPAQAIPFAIEEWCRTNLNTSMPGVIRAYDARTKRARVQPALNAMIQAEDGSVESLPRAPILDVPVQWPGGGGFVFHAPLVAGDAVVLEFSQRGLDAWKEAWALADPPVKVQFEMRDAFAYPLGAKTITPVMGTASGSIKQVTPQADGDLIVVTGATLQTIDGNVFVRVAPDEVRLSIGGATLVRMTDGQIVVSAATIQLMGNVQASGGELTHNTTDVGDTHTHGGVDTGPGDTDVPN